MKANVGKTYAGKYAYVTLLTNDSYANGVFLLKQSMEKVGAQYPLICIVNDEVSAPALEMVRQTGVKIVMKDNIPVPENLKAFNADKSKRFVNIWRNCFTKLHVFDMEEYDKIVFLDADIMLLQNIDSLFSKPHMTAAVDGEYFNLWPENVHFNAGCFVVEPKAGTSEKIMEFASSIDVSTLPAQVIADQEILNLYFADWKDKKELHLDKYYNIFGPYTQEEQLEDLKANCKFIHFIGRKPWAFWIPNPAEHYSEYFYNEARKMIQDNLGKLNGKAITDKNVLTVYAICKNEMKHVDAWLDSYGEADYVCVLDTGSTDGTYEHLLEKQKTMKNLIVGQKIFTPFKFNDARNESMKLIPKETTMFFMNDLDEVIKEKGWAQLVKAAWHPDFTRGRYTYNRDVAEGDVVVKQIPEFRVHSRDWVHWRNTVHEIIEDRTGEASFPFEATTPMPITVWHYGTPHDKSKSTYYAELCELEMKEHPENVTNELQLAIEYDVIEQPEKSHPLYEDMIKKETGLKNYEYARCYFALSEYAYVHNNFAAGDFYAREGRIAAPFYGDNYIVQAKAFLMRKQPQLAVDLIRSAFAQANENHWCSVYNMHGYHVYEVFAEALYATGKFAEAFAAICVAFEMNASDEIKKKKDAIYKQLMQNVTTF